MHRPLRRSVRSGHIYDVVDVIQRELGFVSEDQAAVYPVNGMKGASMLQIRAAGLPVIGTEIGDSDGGLFGQAALQLP